MPGILAWGQSLFLLLKGVITVVLNDTEEIRGFTEAIILTTICYMYSVLSLLSQRSEMNQGLGQKYFR